MTIRVSWAGLEELSFPVPDSEIREWKALPALQQPDWKDGRLVSEIRRDLASMPSLVEQDEIRALRMTLAEVAAGRLRLIQAGDCAEDPAQCEPGFLIGKVALLDALAEAMHMTSGQQIVRVGRIAGQFAKPRSAATERRGGQTLPVFRGHMINGPEPDSVRRRPDPLRMLACYGAADRAMAFLRGHTDAAGLPVWTSHEALVLDYELPLLRRDLDGQLILTSTHWPWIGDRTRQPDGAHVRLLARVRNPVACKVGPGMTIADLLKLCERLDPEREPGRLTLIARLGAHLVTRKLAALVRAVRAARHPVIWLCDPMHGNTVTAPDGRKTRFLTAIIREVREFQAIVASEGGVPGGLHLEATPEPVAECAFDESQAGRAGGRYTTLCDPRLNQMQAVAVARTWYL